MSALFQLPSVSLLSIAGACAFAFCAGLIDSIAGGGGLIQLPGMMTVFPNIPMVRLLSINKTSSVCGTITSFIEYTKKTQSPWKQLLPAAGASFVTSMLGAYTAAHIDNAFLKPLIIALIAALILFTLLKKDYGAEPAESRFSPRAQRLLSLLLGAVMGFYDGFFGPGTGNFLIMGLIFIYGMDFLHASASCKLINATTNIAALLMYFLQGIGCLPLGLAMGCFNLLGARCGVRLAVLKGSSFIRVLFLAVSFALLVRQLLP